MNKKAIALIAVILILIGGIVGAVLLSNNSKTSETNEGTLSTSNLENEDNGEQNLVVTNNETNNLSNENIENNNEENRNTENTSNNKSLVVYFSATNTTEGVAKVIANATNSDITEIVPKQEYTSADLNYNNDNCRANREQNDSSARPEIANNIAIDDYDTIYIGYPIWWGTCPKIILTLLDSYNFDGKTVIPFCTSGGSGISQSLRDLEQYNKNVNWLEGRRFNSSVSNSDVEDWIKDLGL